MTPGQEALVEAMRLESARIYGQLQREHRSVCTVEIAPVVEERCTEVIQLAPPRVEDVA